MCAGTDGVAWGPVSSKDGTTNVRSVLGFVVGMSTDRSTECPSIYLSIHLFFYPSELMYPTEHINLYMSINARMCVCVCAVQRQHRSGERRHEHVLPAGLWPVRNYICHIYMYGPLFSACRTNTPISLHPSVRVSACRCWRVVMWVSICIDVQTCLHAAVLNLHSHARIR